ncbi:MAG: tetratricopeptide repeat protein [Myxococcota bacterium]
MAAAAPQSNARWLHGPASDLLLGAGLVYLPLLFLLVLAGPTVQTWIPFGIMPILALLFSTPHLGATLLRVYERGEDRSRYRYFAIHATIFIALAFLLGLYVPIVGSVMVTIYLTVVPWHFTGQNYGITLIFLRRRGVEVDRLTKRLIYTSFISTYLMALLALHGRAPSADYAPLQVAGTVYRFLGLGIPPQIQLVAFVLLAIVFSAALLTAWLRLRQKAPLRDLLPGGAVVLTQSVWYVLPILVALLLPHRLGPFAASNHAYTFMWVSFAHGIQYLWITTYYARRQKPPTAQPRFLGKALLAGAAIYGFPILVLAPNALGEVPYYGGLFLMISGALNVHHVLLDSAIWKLRDGRIADILIRARSEDATPVAPSSGRRWPRGVVWASGVVAVVLTLFGTFEYEYGFVRAAARGDLERLEVAGARLSSIGRDDANLRASIGLMQAERGDAARAMQSFERSLELFPTVYAWLNVGVLRESGGDVEGALAAYDEAMALEPNNVDALFYSGRAHLVQEDLWRARALLAEAARAAPERADIRETLQLAWKSKGSSDMVVHPGLVGRRP